MPGEILVLDAAGSNPDGTDPGAALNIGPGTNYGLREIAFPAPPQTVQYAGSVDTEGSLPASRKHENRVITAKIMCATLSALQTLQAQVSKIAREGGTLKWVLPDAETIFFDLLAADTFEPMLDIAWHRNAGAYCDVQLALPAKPYGRGIEITLSDHVETTLPWLKFTETTVKGDVPGLARLVIDNDQAAQTQQFLLWGIRSRYYDSASTAALFYQAESCALSSATATTRSGASGSGNTVAFDGSLPSAGGFNPLLYLGASSTAQTHVGSYRVLARVQAPAANTGTVSLRMQWRQTVGSQFVTTDTVTLSKPTTDCWEVADLGQVTLPKAARGSQGWLGIFYAGSTVANDDLYVDWIAFLPLEQSGQARYNAVASGQSIEVAWDGVRVSQSGGYWADPDSYEGDYFLVPPAGREARTVEVFTKFMREPLGTTITGALGGTFGDFIDDISARLFYTPRYLIVPSP